MEKELQMHSLLQGPGAGRTRTRRETSPLMIYPRRKPVRTGRLKGIFRNAVAVTTDRSSVITLCLGT